MNMSVIGGNTVYMHPPIWLSTCVLLFLQMLSCLEHMYHDLGLVRDFNINPIMLKRWLVRLSSLNMLLRLFNSQHEFYFLVFFTWWITFCPKLPVSLSSCLQLCIHDNYKNNPFHNFRHCFCVTQMMYSMICLCSLQVILLRLFCERSRRLEMLFLLHSSACPTAWQEKETRSQTLGDADSI